MNEARCAWCGEKIETAEAIPSFCDMACQRAHEEWCSTQAAARAKAVFRWRDIQVTERRDMLNDLLSAGARPSGQSYYASIRLTQTIIER